MFANPTAIASPEQYKIVKPRIRLGSGDGIIGVRVTATPQSGLGAQAGAGNVASGQLVLETLQPLPPFFALNE